MADFLQDYYTVDYEAFHKFIKEPKSKRLLKDVLLNDKNPFVSTSNYPLHALRYAFGIKYYKKDMSAKSQRLMPRWRKEGRPERFHVGKIYVCLHPLDDYDENGPFDVVSLNYDARVTVLNTILFEAEKSFPAYIESGRVIDQFVAKYPSFKGSYKKIYLCKYGLDENLYTKFQESIQKYPPHSDEAKNIKRFLAEWLCAYHEIRLLSLAYQKAKEKGGVVIYQQQDGTFSLEPEKNNKIGMPKGKKNESSRVEIHKKRELRKSIANLLMPHTDTDITPFSPGDAVLAFREKLYSILSLPALSRDFKAHCQNQCTIRFLFNDHVSPIAKSYIKLTLVQEKDQKIREAKPAESKEEKKEDDREELPTHHTQKESIPIEVEDIFIQSKKSQILILGRAGMGKSTFCQYVLDKWAKGELFSEFHWAFRISLRNLTNDFYPPDKSYTLTDIVYKECFAPLPLTKEYLDTLTSVIERDPILWLIDGFNEFTTPVPEQFKKAWTQLQKKSHLIITSHTDSLPTLKKEFPLAASLEISGFMDSDIKAYVDTFCSMTFSADNTSQPKEEKRAETPVKETALTLINFLKMNPNIWNIAHVPLYLELICSIWLQENSALKDPHSCTITQLYQKITLLLLRRALQKTGMRAAEIVEDSCVLYYLSPGIDALKKLAYYLMKNNKTILTRANFEEIIPEIKDNHTLELQILKLGILRRTDSGASRAVSSTNYCFNHSTFQEYFAAQHLLKQLEYRSGKPQHKETVAFLHREKYNSHYRAIFGFMAGLLKPTRIHSSTFQLFWKILCSEQDIAGIRHIQLMICCLEEARCDFSQRAVLQKQIGKWLTFSIATKNFELMLPLLQQAPHLMRQADISAVLLSRLKNENENVKKITIEAIDYIGTAAATPEVLMVLMGGLISKDSFVARATMRAIVKLGLGEEVKAFLLNALVDSNWDVRLSAIAILRSLGVTSASSEVALQVLTILLEALENTDEYIRLGGLECFHTCLVKFSNAPMKAKISQALLKALGDKENADVRIHAAKILGWGIEAKDDPEVIKALLDSLFDDDSGVREAAADALYELDAENKSEVLSFLLKKLNDPAEPEDRAKAAEALGRLYSKDKLEVTSALVTALDDSDIEVCYYAAEALVWMEASYNHKVTSILIDSLGSDEDDIREGALTALVELSRGDNKSEVLDKLNKALSHPNKEIRRGAVEVLSKVEVEPSPSILANFLKTLSDKDEFVREQVVMALGNVGSEGATVTAPALEKMLNDTSPHVQNATVKALGKLGARGVMDVVPILLKMLSNEPAKHSFLYIAEVLDTLDLTNHLSSCKPVLIKNIVQPKEIYMTCHYFLATPITSFVKTWLDSKSPESEEWLSIITICVLYRAIPITLTKDGIMVYEGIKGSEILFPSAEYRMNFIKAFALQADKLGLPLEFYNACQAGDEKDSLYTDDPKGAISYTSGPKTDVPKPVLVPSASSSSESVAASSGPTSSASASSTEKKEESKEEAKDETGKGAGDLHQEESSAPYGKRKFTSTTDAKRETDPPQEIAESQADGHTKKLRGLMVGGIFRSAALAPPAFPPASPANVMITSSLSSMAAPALPPSLSSVSLAPNRSTARVSPLAALASSDTSTVVASQDSTPAIGSTMAERMPSVTSLTSSLFVSTSGAAFFSSAPTSASNSLAATSGSTVATTSPFIFGSPPTTRRVEVSSGLSLIAMGSLEEEDKGEAAPMIEDDDPARATKKGF